LYQRTKSKIGYQTESGGEICNAASASRAASEPGGKAEIENVNWPETKAPRLQALMHRITEERGELNLDFLRDLPVDEGAAWLRRLGGVGPKTTACVLLFSCQKPILPVDTRAPTWCFQHRTLSPFPA
jgi:endonuclease-3